MTKNVYMRIEPKSYSGHSFSDVFQEIRYKGEVTDSWRVKGSGVHTQPENAETTFAVVNALKELGFKATVSWGGGPGWSSSYHIYEKFLGGNFRAVTGNYFYSERGAWIYGKKAVLLVALKLGLKVRRAWRKKYNLEDATLDSLVVELNREQHM